MHRMTLRTGARDTKSVRTISLMERSCSKSARRISPILSTPIIPISPSQPTEAKGKDADTQRQRGSLLDAKITPQGVIIASEFTSLDNDIRLQRTGSLDRLQDRNDAGRLQADLVQPADQALKVDAAQDRHLSAGLVGFDDGLRNDHRFSLREGGGLRHDRKLCHADR